MSMALCKCTVIDLGDDCWMHKCTVCGSVYLTHKPKHHAACKKNKPQREDCQHLGGLFGREPCPSCKGRVQVKVFKCDLHHRCTMHKDIGLAVCSVCHDYLPKSQEGSPAAC